MQLKRQVVALIEPAAQNVDANTQKAVIARYAAKHGLEIDWTIGEGARGSGTAAEPEHRNLINNIRNRGVARLLVLAEVEYLVPPMLLEECRKTGVKVDFIDVQRERGLL